MVAMAIMIGAVNASPGQSALVGNSPFAPSGIVGTAAGSAPQDYELAGSSSVGRDVTVCIYERQARHSQWIPVGGVSDGIKVISFDAVHDEAVVLVSGVRKEITMRKPTFGAGNSFATNRPAPPISVAPPPPIGGPPPAATGTPEQEQREARMLVSDLLEIGVQQRKAYQDAKLKSAGGNPPGQSN